jgi:hypothetical protein
VRQDAVVRRTERWFIRQGMPNLIADYRFRSHVLPRMLPFLAAVIVVSVGLLLLLTHTDPEGGLVAGGVIVVIGLLGLPVALARWARRDPRLSRGGAVAVLTAYAATPLVIPVLLIGAYAQRDRALVIGRPSDATAALVAGTALVLAVAFAAIFAATWFATAYGLVPLAARAIGHAAKDMRGGLQLQGRALPTLLFVTFFLFFTSELWQLMNHLAWFRLVLVLVLFASVTVLATSTRLRGEIDRVEQDLSPARLTAACAGTPLTSVPSTVETPPALTARQQTNVLMVLVTRQLIQAAVVGLGLFAFFVILGLIIVDNTTARAWVVGDPEFSAWVPFMPVALFRSAALLAGFGSMYFAITTMTQTEYRHEFFEPVVEDVERALAVRAVYLSVRTSPSAVPSEGHVDEA